MGDAENALPSSKKRAAGREISRDNPGLDDVEDLEQETGTFKKASEEVLATRRMVKVRRQQNPASASSNPFANISLVPPPTVPTAKVTEVTTEQQAVDEKLASEGGEGSTEDTGSVKAPASLEMNEKDALKETTGEVGAGSADKEESDCVVEKSSAFEETEEKEPVKGAGERQEAEKDNGHGDASPSATTPLNSFQQLSSTQNAFIGLSGTGFSSSTFSFGSISKDGPAFGSGSAFGVKNKGAIFPSFNFGKSSNGSSSLFGAAGASDASKSENTSLPSMHEVPVETGEENEKAVFTADAVLFEYIDGGWKERGKGELKVNVSTSDAERARLLMRARGNYRLILNASLFPDMKLTGMDKRGITFACMNSTGEGKNGLTTFALKFKDGSVVEEFRAVVAVHKGKSAILKTPENSPKTSDD